uniref:Uncharacterized protein n=1 Tax=Oncorhynchus tshawytscha TaxID=74940 RepID=A0A8C8FM55_ONCTS
VYRRKHELGGQFLGLSLLQLGNTGCGLRTHDTTSPVTTDLEEEAHCHDCIFYQCVLLVFLQKSQDVLEQKHYCT